jgi:hypothetical protein
MRIKIPWEGETVDQFVVGLQDQVRARAFVVFAGC